MNRRRSGRRTRTLPIAKASNRPENLKRTDLAAVMTRMVKEYLAQHEHEYEQLVLVCAPKFLGQLRKQLGKPVKQKVSEEISLICRAGERGKNTFNGIRQ